MKITSVEPQKKNPHRYNIFLDGEFAFGADEDLVVNKRLIKDKEISERDLQVLLKEAKIGKHLDKVYALLSRRERSEKEIRDYFKRKNFEAKIKDKDQVSELEVNEIIDRLKQKRFINDLEFARAWVQSRSRKKGKNALKSELIQKGIDKEIIEDVLTEKGGETEEKTAAKLLGKRIERWKNLPNAEIKQKSLRFLMSRGFDYDTSKEVIIKILQQEEIN